MPRYASYQLRWLEQEQTYALSIDGQTSKQTLSNSWLEQIASFSFHGRSGMHYTVRKQRVQRGSSYWYGYRRLHGRIAKRYLGKTEDLTFARLEEIAHLLQNSSSSNELPFQPSQKAALPLPTPPSSLVGALPLLLSKLSPPRLHAFLLDRPNLFALLDAGQEGNLTLLSAPAGFGKTTLVCQWLAAQQTKRDIPLVAWLTLETSDNDPLRFWRYLITACQAFQVDLTESHDVLHAISPQPPFMPISLENVLTTFLNALAQCPTRCILVLEDFHTIIAPQIHETISFFLDHLPTNIHLIMLTRSDPPFSLAKLRVSNNLSEIRTTDLRFSPEETTLLLQQSLSFSLAPETRRRIYAQLEGWGAGLHLIKLALQRTTSPAAEEQALMLFTRNDPFFQEYFINEVLELQPAPVQLFLLQTSILNRLTASLCDAVIEQANSQEMLRSLERANLFLEPLDTSEQWYQYQALFAAAMRTAASRRLGEEQLQLFSLRASHWYEARGLLGESIDAALFAQDYRRATTLIERSIKEHTFPGEIHEPHTLHRWLEQLPESILQQHPVLCLSYATTLLFLSNSWNPDTATRHMLEKILLNAEDGFLRENHLHKSGEVFAFRALVSLRQGDMQTATQYAKKAHELLPQTQQIWRGLCLCIIGRDHIEAGHFQEAHAAFIEAYTLCKAVENLYFQRISLIMLAQLSFEEGEIQQATSSYRQVLSSAREEKHMNTLNQALIGLATLFYEDNELESSSQHVEEALSLSRSHDLISHEVHASLVLARLQQAQGQTTTAQQQLSILLEKIPPSLPQLSQEIQAALAQIALAVGDQITTQHWVTNRKPPHVFSQRLEEELLLARWLRQQDKEEEASHLLERLLATTRGVEHTRRHLEIQIEMILLKNAQKRKTEAKSLLQEILIQTLGRNSLRLFLDAGEQMALLLHSLLPQVHEPPLIAYIRTLLSSFPLQQQIGTPALTAALIEPLSPQELRVLRLLNQHHSNAEIAHQLVVSINTIRTQVQSIYRKLGVNKRSAACEIARDLHLL